MAFVAGLQIAESQPARLVTYRGIYRGEKKHEY